MSAQPMYDQYGRLITTQYPNPMNQERGFGEILATTAINFVGQKVLGNIFGGSNNGAEQGQSTAIDRPTQAPKETARSGEIAIPDPGNYQGSSFYPTMQAGLPALVGTGIQAAAKFLPQIIGGAAIGAAAPVVMNAITGQPQKLRVTKKLKSQVRQAVNLLGIEGAAQAMGVDVNTILYILMKKMRNDGPYVTKAAVRKTRQTIRKLDTLCDLKDEMCPPKRTTARKRPAMARTRVTNIKN